MIRGKDSAFLGIISLVTATNKISFAKNAFKICLVVNPVREKTNSYLGYFFCIAEGKSGYGLIYTQRLYYTT